MGHPVVYFEILAKKPQELRAFYRDVLGWEIGQPAPGVGVDDYTIVKPAGRAGIAGGIGATPAGYDGHVTFYVAVPDVVQALATIERSGGTKMLEPERVPNGPIIALFRDPEGYVIGLVQEEAQIGQSRSRP